MARKRKKKLPVSDVFVPTNIFDVIGTKEDVCFGKEYDLSTDECKRCGDSEICAVCFAQFMNKTRKQVEEENNFKDMETMVDPDKIKKYMRGLKRKNKSKKEIIHGCMDKYNLDIKTIRSIYREL